MFNKKELQDLYKMAIDDVISQDIINYEDNSLSRILKGISHYQRASLPVTNTEDFTFIFFTRPDLNLSDYNISRDRVAIGFLNKEHHSIQNYTRLILDPKLNSIIKSPLVEHRNPFIPILSNTIESMSGWPDEVLESWISKNGMRKEQWGYADGINKVYYSFDLDVTFTNTIEEPVSHLLDLWTNYMTNVRLGNFTPHPHNLTGRKTDYMTGIYVIVTNTNYRIKKIAKTIAYPVANPKGRYFNYTRNETKSNQLKDINFRFKCFGAEYNDPILMYEFNMLMSSYHRGIYDMFYNANSDDMVEVNDALKPATSYRTFPVIDLRYNTLEFVMSKKDLKIEDKIQTFNK